MLSEMQEKFANFYDDVCTKPMKSVASGRANDWLIAMVKIRWKLEWRILSIEWLDDELIYLSVSMHFLVDFKKSFIHLEDLYLKTQLTSFLEFPDLLISIKSFVLKFLEIIKLLFIFKLSFPWIFLIQSFIMWSWSSRFVFLKEEFLIIQIWNKKIPRQYQTIRPSAG